MKTNEMPILTLYGVATILLASCINYKPLDTSLGFGMGDIPVDPIDRRSRLVHTLLTPQKTKCKVYRRRILNFKNVGRNIAKHLVRRAKK